ncbi:MAG: class I SAM-dependent methyltransferase [Planctomycetes bacterium]|nr:class I SAM-dependent methyltransferase [Planctomycetota bacterium]
MATIGLYADPLVYDVLHSPGTAQDLDGLLRIAARFAPGGAPGPARRRPRWLEAACGTGRYLRAAQRRGIDVVGFDLAPAMVAYARSRLVRGDAGLGRGRVVVADMTRFARALGGRRFDLAFNLINTFRHLPDDRAALAHLREVARVLRPAGVYALGITLNLYGEEVAFAERWEGRRGACHVRQTVRYVPPGSRSQVRARIERIESRLVVRRGRRVERHASEYPLRSYDHGQWHALLARSPLRVVAVVDERGRAAEENPGEYQIYVLGRRGRAG